MKKKHKRLKSSNTFFTGLTLSKTYNRNEGMSNSYYESFFPDKRPLKKYVEEEFEKNSY
mgnify:CR=1 FL=1